MVNFIDKGTFPAGTKLRLGVPSEQPEEAINALVKLFSAKKNVELACLGLMEIISPNGESKFTYTIGFQCSFDERKTITDAVEILKHVPTGRWEISIVPLSDTFFSPEAIVFFGKKKKKEHWLSKIFRSE